MSFIGKTINGRPHVPAKVNNVLDADVVYTLRFDKMRKPQRDKLIEYLEAGDFSGWGNQPSTICRMLTVRAPSFGSEPGYRAVRYLSSDKLQAVKAKLALVDCALLTGGYVHYHGWNRPMGHRGSDYNPRRAMKLALAAITQALEDEGIPALMPEDRAFLDTVIAAVKARVPFKYEVKSDDA